MKLVIILNGNGLAKQALEQCKPAIFALSFLVPNTYITVIVCRNYDAPDVCDVQSFESWEQLLDFIDSVRAAGGGSNASNAVVTALNIAQSLSPDLVLNLVHRNLPLTEMRLQETRSEAAKIKEHGWDSFLGMCGKHANIISVIHDDRCECDPKLVSTYGCIGQVVAGSQSMFKLMFKLICALFGLSTLYAQQVNHSILDAKIKKMKQFKVNAYPTEKVKIDKRFELVMEDCSRSHDQIQKFLIHVLENCPEDFFLHSQFFVWYAMSNKGELSPMISKLKQQYKDDATMASSIELFLDVGAEVTPGIVQQFKDFCLENGLIVMGEVDITARSMKKQLRKQPDKILPYLASQVVSSMVLHQEVNLSDQDMNYFLMHLFVESGLQLQVDEVRLLCIQLLQKGVNAPSVRRCLSNLMGTLNYKIAASKARCFLTSIQGTSELQQYFTEKELNNMNDIIAKGLYYFKRKVKTAILEAQIYAKLREQPTVTITCKSCSGFFDNSLMYNEELCVWCHPDTDLLPLTERVGKENKANFACCTKCDRFYAVLGNNQPRSDRDWKCHGCKTDTPSQTNTCIQCLAQFVTFEATEGFICGCCAKSVELPLQSHTFNMEEVLKTNPLLDSSFFDESKQPKKDLVTAQGHLIKKYNISAKNGTCDWCYDDDAELFPLCHNTSCPQRKCKQCIKHKYGGVPGGLVRIMEHKCVCGDIPNVNFVRKMFPDKVWVFDWARTHKEELEGTYMRSCIHCKSFTEVGAMQCGGSEPSIDPASKCENCIEFDDPDKIKNICPGCNQYWGDVGEGCIHSKHCPRGPDRCMGQDCRWCGEGKEYCGHDYCLICKGEFGHYGSDSCPQNCWEKLGSHAYDAKKCINACRQLNLELTPENVLDALYELGLLDDDDYYSD